MKYSYFLWLTPLFLLAGITPFSAELDMALASKFYDTEKGSFGHNAFYTFMFHWGILPALIGLAVAAVILALSLFFPRYRAWRHAAMAYIFTLSIGAGLITNSILKDHWGRPRPRQVSAFGGHYPFRPYYKPDFTQASEPRRSFPCGHCTMGFTFLSLAWSARHRRQKKLFWMAIFSAVVLGSLLGLTRMAQGGHFFSDVLAGAVIMFFTSLGIDWLLYREE